MRSGLVSSSGYPIYTLLNRLLDNDGLDSWLVGEGPPCFVDGARPSIPPGVSFQLFLVEHLEGFRSERCIAWFCLNRMSLRETPGYLLHEKTPDHSSLTICQQRLDEGRHDPSCLHV